LINAIVLKTPYMQAFDHATIFGEHNGLIQAHKIALCVYICTYTCMYVFL